MTEHGTSALAVISISNDGAMSGIEEALIDTRDLTRRRNPEAISYILKRRDFMSALSSSLVIASWLIIPAIISQLLSGGTSYIDSGADGHKLSVIN